MEVKCGSAARSTANELRLNSVWSVGQICVRTMGEEDECRKPSHTVAVGEQAGKGSMSPKKFAGLPYYHLKEACAGVRLCNGEPPIGDILRRLKLT